MFRSPDDAFLNSPPDKSTREIGEEWISGQPWTIEPDSQRQNKSAGNKPNPVADLQKNRITSSWGPQLCQNWREWMKRALPAWIEVQLWCAFGQLPTSWNEWSSKLQQVVLWSNTMIKSDTWRVPKLYGLTLCPCVWYGKNSSGYSPNLNLWLPSNISSRSTLIAKWSNIQQIYYVFLFILIYQYDCDNYINMIFVFQCTTSTVWLVVCHYLMYISLGWHGGSGKVKIWPRMGLAYVHF